MSDLFKGAACFFKGLSLLTKPVIRRYAVAPIIVSTVLFALLIWFFVSQFDGIVEAMMARVPDWLAWLEWLLWIVFALLTGGLVFFTFVLLAGLVGSPFYGFLAEAVEVHLAGTRAPSVPLVKSLVQLPRTLLGEVAKIVYALVLAVPFLVLFLIPVINIAAPVLWFLFCAWTTAFAYADYAMSNHGLGLREIRRVLGRRRLLALGFGSVAFLVLLIPFVNLLALPAAVAGGAVLWVEELREPTS